MGLDGNNKKKAKNIKIRVESKKSNVKGYKLRYEWYDEEERHDDERGDCYLVKSDGEKVYLGKVYI